MANLTLTTFANGDTDYVAEMNNNFSAVAAAINALDSSSAVSAATSLVDFLNALYPTTLTLIGASSFKLTTSGTTVMVSSGSAWNPSKSTLVQSSAALSLNMSSYPSNLYYVNISDAGVLSIGVTATNALWSFSWNGVAISAITLLANVFMSSADQKALLHSTTNNVTYASLLARLEAIETLVNTKT